MIDIVTVSEFHADLLTKLLEPWADKFYLQFRSSENAARPLARSTPLVHRRPCIFVADTHTNTHEVAIEKHQTLLFYFRSVDADCQPVMFSPSIEVVMWEALESTSSYDDAVRDCWELGRYCPKQYLEAHYEKYQDFKYWSPNHWKKMREHARVKLIVSVIEKND